MSLYKDLPEESIAKVKSPDDARVRDIPGFLHSFLGERCSFQKVNADLAHMTLVIDNSHVRAKHVVNRKTKLNAKEKRRLKLYDISKECGRYEDYLPLHQLWLEYFREVVRTSRSLLQEGNQADLGAKLLKADYHGCILSVTRSKCPSYVGVSGILLQETRNILRIITTNGLKSIPKQNSVFTFQVDGHVFTIYGNHFRLKSSERAVKRFKSKASLDL